MPGWVISWSCSPWRLSCSRWSSAPPPHWCRARCGASGGQGGRPPGPPDPPAGSIVLVLVLVLIVVLLVQRVRSEEHTSELQSLMRLSYAVFCLTKKHPSQQLQLKQTPY